MLEFVLFLLFLLIAAPASAKTRNVTVEGHHGKLSAIIQTPCEQDKYPMVIICHGFMGHKKDLLLKKLADALELEGIASIRFDFNGHGESEGRLQDMTVRNEIEDAKKIFNYVGTLAEVTTISIVGHSQGGVVASMLAGELNEQIKSVVLFTPAAVLRENAIIGVFMYETRYDPLDPPEYIELYDYKIGRNYVLVARDLPIYEVASQYKGAACMIHGTADIAVPYTYSMRYAEIWKDSELHIIPKWDHLFTGCEAEAAKIATEFFVKILK